MCRENVFAWGTPELCDQEQPKKTATKLAWRHHPAWGLAGTLLQFVFKPFLADRSWNLKY
jgi:hypothetical protein